MSAHTPGPWGITPRTNKRGHELTPAITAPRNGYRGFPVCIVSAIGAGEDEANARLIAAAPTMRADLATLSRACRRLLTPDQCATLSADEEAAFGRAEEVAEAEERS